MKFPPASVVKEFETYGVKKVKYTFSKSEVLDCIIKKHKIALYNNPDLSHTFDLYEGYEDELARAILVVSYKAKES